MLQLAPHIQAGQRLKAAMRARGWTLADLSAATVLSVRTCCTLQQGQGNVGNYTRCCIALGIPTGFAGGNSPSQHLRTARWDDRQLVTILEGDCFAIMPTPTMADGSIPCTVTSIPYLNQKVYNGRLGWGNGTLEEYLADCGQFFRELLRVTADTGSAWINVGFKRIGGRLIDVPSLVAQVAEPEGFYLRNKIVWFKKGRGLDSARNRPRGTYEIVLFLTKKASGYYYDQAAERISNGSNLPDYKQHREEVRRWPHINEDEKTACIAKIDQFERDGIKYRLKLRGERPGSGRGAELARKGYYFYTYNKLGAMRPDVWEFSTSSDPVHPCPMPLELAERCIAIGCPPGAVTFDPCMGSGTTAVAALKLGRLFWGIEIEPLYVSRAYVRLLQSDAKSG